MESNQARKYAIYFTSALLSAFLLYTGITHLAGKIGHIIFLLVTAFLLSCAIEQPVHYLVGKRINRKIATLLTLFILITLLAILLVSMGAVVLSEVKGLSLNLTKYSSLLSETLNHYHVKVSQDKIFKIMESDKKAIAKYFAKVPKETGNLLGNLSIIGFLTYYLVSDGYKFRRLICRNLPPKAQEAVLEIWQTTIDKTGSYLLTRSGLILISSFYMTLVSLLLKLPYPWAIALWFGVISQMLPIIGTYIGLSVPLLLAISHSIPTAVTLILSVVIFQLITDYILLPKLASKTLKLHPALIFIAVLVGGSLLGITGAIISIPVTATVASLWEGLGHRHEIDHEHDLLINYKNKRNKN